MGFFASSNFNMLCLLQTCLDGFNTDVNCHRLILPDATTRGLG